MDLTEIHDLKKAFAGRVVRNRKTALDYARE